MIYFHHLCVISEAEALCKVISYARQCYGCKVESLGEARRITGLVPF